MEFKKDETCSTDYSDDKDSEELNLNILEEHFEEINVDPVLENKEQVDNLIKKYIKIIRLDCTDEVLKKKMIRKLCDLRLRQCELIEEQEINSISGHLFQKMDCTTNYCDICMKKQNGLYIPILNTLSYGQLNVCVYCGYSMHVECQSELFNNKKIRDCPKLLYERQLVKISPTKELNNFVILDICVEKSLSEQEYKCNDCRELINFETSLLCDYDGFYYCRNCHNNDLAIIPARVIHNWDFIPRGVSKNSNYTLNYVKNKPVLFNVLELNSMLYGFIDELPIVKRLRYELNLMVKYIILCKKPSKPKITISNHLIDSNLINSYSLSDLQDLPNLKKTLTDFHSELFDHITKNCETCRGNGFFCELCPGHHDRGGILFPFSPNISLCPICHAVFHKNCFYRKKICTRCKRIEKKENELIAMTDNFELKTVDADKINVSSDNVDSELKLGEEHNEIEESNKIEEDNKVEEDNKIEEDNEIKEDNLSENVKIDEKDEVNDNNENLSEIQAIEIEQFKGEKNEDEVTGKVKDKVIDKDDEMSDIEIKQVENKKNEINLIESSEETKENMSQNKSDLDEIINHN